MNQNNWEPYSKIWRSISCRSWSWPLKRDNTETLSSSRKTEFFIIITDKVLKKQLSDHPSLFFPIQEFPILWPYQMLRIFFSNGPKRAGNRFFRPKELLDWCQHQKSKYPENLSIDIVIMYNMVCIWASIIRFLVSVFTLISFPHANDILPCYIF